MKSVAERLAWARTKGGLSQRRLGLLAGLSNRHVCSLESPPGRKGALQGHMHAETVQSLARVLGVRVAWLAFGEGRQPTVRTIKNAVRTAEEAWAAAHPENQKEAS